MHILIFKSQSSIFDFEFETYRTETFSLHGRKASVATWKPLQNTKSIETQMLHRNNFNLKLTVNMNSLGI